MGGDVGNIRNPPGLVSSLFAEIHGKNDAAETLSAAQRRADAKAAALLAARECPPDLIEWGRLHRIPEFARATWQAGFLAGMRAAEMEGAPDAE